MNKTLDVNIETKIYKIYKIIYVPFSRKRFQNYLALADNESDAIRLEREANMFRGNNDYIEYYPVDICNIESEKGKKEKYISHEETIKELKNKELFGIVLLVGNAPRWKYEYITEYIKDNKLNIDAIGIKSSKDDEYIKYKLIHISNENIPNKRIKIGKNFIVPID